MFILPNLTTNHSVNFECQRVLRWLDPSLFPLTSLSLSLSPFSSLEPLSREHKRMWHLVVRKNQKEVPNSFHSSSLSNNQTNGPHASLMFWPHLGGPNQSCLLSPIDPNLILDPLSISQGIMQLQCVMGEEKQDWIRVMEDLRED